MADASRPRTVLVANRGEIAVRVLRTVRALGWRGVVVHSDADAGSAAVRLADEAIRVGPGPVDQSYLDTAAVLAAAKSCGADLLHPGYGLLSENAEFATACEAQGVAFAGPTPDQIRAFGEKHRARDLAEDAGLPLCPGTGLLSSTDEAIQLAEEIGYPLLLKASSGGGGIGMELCDGPDALRASWEKVRRLAEAHFGRGDAFLERYVARARHVEVQIFGDGEGRVATLGERDCSLQRRRQKVFEETPAPELSDRLRSEMHEAAAAIARSVAYRSAGTVEFLVDVERDCFYFLEVNTRLQVEHGVTEAIYGVDLVEWMLRLAAGEAAVLPERLPTPSGHALEVRLYAEDPSRDFQPSTGTLGRVAFPAEVRVDTWVRSGTEITPFYDPLLAKVVAHGPDRRAAIAALDAALARTRLDGIPTNLAWSRDALALPDFVAGTHDTGSLAAVAHAPLALDVVAPGIATTVQEWPGRLGYWHVGVPPSGPMDDRSFRLGNRILGNEEGAAGLEIVVQGPTLRFASETTLCLTGAEIEASVDGAAVASWEPFVVAAGSELRLGAIPGPGSRAYLLVRGGIAVPELLGSRATFALGRFGGHQGRALVAGDRLPLGDPAASEGPLGAADARALALPLCDATEAWEVGVLDGPHAQPDFFTEADIETFYATEWEVHYQSARTGTRLIGPKPGWARSDGGDAGLHPSNIHDTAYAIGAIDFTGDMPVVLGPDGPSLGGFTCPAVVARAELWKLGQVRPGDRIRFRPIASEEAIALDDAQRARIASRQATAPVPTLASRSAAIDDGVIVRRAADGAIPELTIRRAGERTLLVEVGPMVLDLELRIRIELLMRAIAAERERGTLPGLIDLTPGIRSLQVHFDPSARSATQWVDRIQALDAALGSGDGLTLPARTVHLPLSWDDPATQEAIAKYESAVRDDAPWCPSNLEFIRRINGLDSIDDVRRIVTEASYLVLGLGDVYLGAPVATPLDPRHRLVTTKYNPARTWTPENAVGIGGAYLCVYGMEGPGGYQFVGRTVPVWNTWSQWAHQEEAPAAEQVPWLLRFFDQIRFHEVGADELLALRAAVRDGRHAIEIESTPFDVGAYRRFLDEIADESAAHQARQRAAFEAERERWRASGEFEAAEAAADAADLAGPDDDAELPEGSSAVTAPLGGQVWRVVASEGDEVGAGDELVVLSAMKTETAVHAPSAGRVTKLLCQEGQVVNAGQALVALEPRS